MEKTVILVIVAALFIALPFALELINVVPQGTVQNSIVPDSYVAPEQNDVPPQVQDYNGIVVSPDPYASCFSGKNSSEKNACIKDKAIELMDFSGCGFADSFYQYECLKKYAIGATEGDACASIPVELDRFECYSALGKSSKEQKYCLEIPLGANNYFRGTCFDEVARATNDPAVCTKINFYHQDGVNVRAACIESFYSTLADNSVCKFVVDANSTNDCYYAVAKNNNDYTQCSVIPVQYDRDECAYYFAVNDENKLICAEISRETLRESCEYEVILLNPLETCLAETTNASKYDCLIDLAVSEDDDSHCELIEGDFTKKALCYKGIAELRGDEEFCRKISSGNPDEKEECYYNVAIANNNTDLCELLKISKNYVSCFVEITNNLSDISICNFPQKNVISSYSYYSIRDLCIKDYSIKVGNINNCERVNNADVKVACYDLNSGF